MSRFLAPSENISGTTSGKDSYWDNVYSHNLLSATEGLFTQNVTAYEFIGIGSQLTQVFGTDTTKLPLSGGELTGALTGTEGLFTISLSAPNLSGTFYGDGSGLTGVYGTDNSKLPLSGGELTGALTGTEGLFTISLSAPNLSGTFYGDGSKLSGISGIDVDKLPLVGGVLTGGLTGTEGLFTTSLSAPNISGTFYGDGSGLSGIVGINSDALPLSGGELTGALTGTEGLFTISLSAPSLSGTFYGDGSKLSGLSGFSRNDNTKLPLSGGELTGALTGTEGLFTVSLSAPNISGTFYGDGSGLSGIAGTSNDKLPLSGGELTGALTGTEGLFTVSLSAPSLSGTFYGDGSKLSGITGSGNNKLPLSGGELTGALTGTEGLFTISLSAPSLSGAFYGDGSGLTNLIGIDNGKLPLSGGILTNGLTGTSGLFTISLSAPSLSGSFYGDGSGLTGVSGTDGSKLSLAGGVLTGALTGTEGLFTVSLSAPNLSGTFYGDGSGLTNLIGIDNSKLALSGGRIDGNLIINGSLTALSSATFVNTVFTTTSALSVINYGAGPALYIFQTSGAYDIASFYDQDYGEVFHIGNDGRIGVRESDPNKELTVNGEISAKGDIWANSFRGDGSLLTNIVGTDSSKLPLSGGLLTGALTGTVGLFTTSLSSASISGSFFGDGSGLTGVSGIDGSKLPLGGGNLTGSLTGTVGLFTTSLSAPNLSGNFFGDGSGLTNILATDFNKLPLSGGTLTGGVTGTTALFNNISAQSISGTFYGDASNGIGAPHYYVTCRISTNQVGVMSTSTTPHTFTYNTTGAIPAIDGVTPTVGDIILFGAQSTSTQSGPWKVVNAGSVGVSAVLERPNFFSGTVKFGTSFTITKGTSFQGSTYNLFSAPAGINDITVGFTNLFFGISFSRGANNATNASNTFTGTQTLAVGSTTLAPLRFQAGTLLTTPVQHTVEWDGNFMYLTTSGANSARTTNVAFVSAPATSSSYGLAGQVAYDSTFLYVCTAPNTWVKASITTSGIALAADGTKLPLSGGALTGSLTGTVATFTTSVSAPSISGSFTGDGSRLTSVSGTDNTKLPLAGGVLTGSLTGTTATFTTSIFSPSISGTHYGNGSLLTGITGIDITKLPLSGGTLTGGLNGTVATFTTSVSAPSISGSFTGDGSRLTGVSGTDNTKLSLAAGGALSGALFGTTATFSVSLSSPSISGTHYGDGSLLTGVTGIDITRLPLTGGVLTGGLTGTRATFNTSVSSPNISGTFYGDGSNIFNIPAQINFIFDGGSSIVQENAFGYIQIPYNTRILSWTLLANQPTNSIVQVLTSNFASHPTYTIISGLSDQPALVNATKASSSTMTGWVTAIPADSYLQFVVTSNDNASSLTISLKCSRSS